MTKFKKLFYYLSTTCLLAIVSICTYLVFCRTVKHQDFPKVFGFSAAKVISDSMDPTIIKGDTIVIKECKQYYLGDIITYDDSSTYVTHRIVEVNDNSFITKGDNNNVSDANPVSLESIQGKVVFTVPALNRIFTSKQVYIGLLIITVLVLFFTDFVNLFKNKKISLKGLLIKSLFAFAFLYVMSIATFSKYTSNITGNDKVHTATFFIDGEEVTQNISFSDWIPGSSQNYNIIIKNFDDSTVANTAQRYHLILKRQNNLPLIYSLSSVNSSDSSSGSMLENKQISFENNIGILDGGTIPADKAISHEYKLNISWPENQNSLDLSEKSEDISITIESVQLDSIK